MLTREDMLRELELLPVWQLRVPVAEKAPEVVRVSTRHVGLKPDLPVEEAAPEITAQAIIESPIFTHIVSEDGVYVFVLPNTELSAEESQLFQNICKAMCIKTKPVVATESTADIIKANQAKLVIIMGETTAQAMLQVTETLASLRGKLQQFQGVALVATYDLAHLLQNLPDKAKAWDDLRLAMQALQDLEL